MTDLPPPSFAQLNPGLTSSPFPPVPATAGHRVPYTGDGNASNVIADPQAPPGLFPSFVVVYDSTGGSGDSMIWFSIGAVGVGANGNVVTAAFGLGTMDVGTGATHTGQNILNNTYTAVFYYGN